MELPLYELVKQENEDESGVDFIALVDKPAIKRNWIAFSEQIKFSFKSDTEKRIISGPAMIPDEPIYRKDKDGNEYNVIFRKETIQKIVQKYFKQQNTSNFNLQHKKSLLAQGVYLIESFVIDNERGINAPKGFEDLPDGSWFISCKVDNDEIWNDFVKEQVFKGFSVEGLFMEKEVTSEENEFRELNGMIDKLKQKNKNIITDMSEAKTLLAKLKEIFSEDEKPNEVVMSESKLADGITIVKWDGELKEGTAVSVVSEEGEIPAPDGDHELQDGRKITIEGGKVTKVEAAKEQIEDEKSDDEVEVVMSEVEKQVLAFSEKLESFESKVKSLEEKASKDAEIIAHQAEELKAQKAAFKMMFEIVEKLADEPSEKVESTNTFNLKFEEKKKREDSRLNEVLKFLNK
jgi:hypothetical protein